MLRKELIKLDLDAGTSEEALRIMAGMFVELGVVKETYPDAIVNRESNYPTGLPATAFDIAVPHTFAEHVNEPAIGIGILGEESPRLHTQPWKGEESPRLHAQPWKGEESPRLHAQPWKGVEFRQMGSPEIILHPKLIFMLAITDPKDQISLLRKIMKLIQNPEALNQIKDASSADEVCDIVNPLLF